MPTPAQQQELIENCSWTWTARNGVSGQLVTGPNGNIIFLPAAGLRWGDSLSYVGTSGGFWSRTLSLDFSSDACDLGFSSGGVGWYSYSRAAGFTVRAVRVP